MTPMPSVFYVVQRDKFQATRCGQTRCVPLLACALVRCGHVLCSPLLSLKSGGQVWLELDQFSGLPASAPLLRESSL